MVVISSKESYCHGIMQSMNQLRLEGRLCDVSLVVKDKTIEAHRCVLVAGSETFFKLSSAEHEISIAHKCLNSQS